MTDSLDIQDTPVYSYPIASGDMRYIEIGERDIYLRNDPESGLIFQGQIAGCGPKCHFELNEILLEYALSCEGCRDQGLATKEVIQFGKYLGEVLGETIAHQHKDSPDSQKISNAFKCVLNSMSANYIEHIKSDRIEYRLDCCPLSECARNIGLNRSITMAYISFVALCRSLIKNIAPGWELKKPNEEGSDIPMHKIVISSY